MFTKTLNKSFAAKAILVSAAAGALTLTTTTAAFAHASAQNVTAPAGGYGSLDIRVPHGCEGLPVDAVAVKIPAGIDKVTPEQIPGWEVSFEYIPSDNPDLEMGKMDVVTWTAVEQPLADGFFMDFGMSLKFPATEEPVLYFPTVQYCGDTEVAWSEIPAEGQDPHSLDYPAPRVTLTGGHGGHSEEESGVADTLVALGLAAGVGAVAGAAGGVLVARSRKTVDSDSDNV